MILARSESSCIFTSTHNVETFILPRLAGGGKLGGLMEARGLSTSPTAMGPAMKVVMTEISCLSWVSAGCANCAWLYSRLAMHGLATYMQPKYDRPKWL